MLGARVIDYQKLRTGRVIVSGLTQVKVKWHNGEKELVPVYLLEFQPAVLKQQKMIIEKLLMALRINEQVILGEISEPPNLIGANDELRQAAKMMIKKTSGNK